MLPEQQCYIARDQNSAIVCAILDKEKYRKIMAKLAALCIEEGLNLERVTTDTVREEFIGDGTAQLSLLG